MKVPHLAQTDLELDFLMFMTGLVLLLKVNSNSVSANMTLWQL